MISRLCHTHILCKKKAALKPGQPFVYEKLR